MKKKITFYLKICIFSYFTVFIFFKIFTLSYVSTSSMLPNLLIGDYTIHLKKDFYSNIERGDIVLVKNTKNINLLDSCKCYEKRVIGLPNEEIKFENGKVYINNKLLDEPYLPLNTYTFDGGYSVSYKIPEGYYFVIGDNRGISNKGEVSYDSRFWTCPYVKKENIEGKFLFKIGK